MTRWVKLAETEREGFSEVSALNECCSGVKMRLNADFGQILHGWLCSYASNAPHNAIILTQLPRIAASPLHPLLDPCR